MYEKSPQERDETGDCDFVSQVSKRLPQWTIYEMVGLPPERQDEAVHSADGMVSWTDEEVQGGREPAQVLLDSAMSLINIGLELAEDRRVNPAEYLMTNLGPGRGRRAEARRRGDRRVLLSALRRGQRHHPQLDDDWHQGVHRILRPAQAPHGGLRRPDPGRVEETVRWASPVATFRRTATEDTVLGGREIVKGDWVVMFYASGNRDESVFTDPWKFDITRSPNHHVGFGGGGPHFCMGAQLARTQLRMFFKELFTRVPDIDAGEPNYFVGNFMTAVKCMPVKTNL